MLFRSHGTDSNVNQIVTGISLVVQWLRLCLKSGPLTPGANAATWGVGGGAARAQPPGLLSFSFLGEDGLVPLMLVSFTGQ